MSIRTQIATIILAIGIVAPVAAATVTHLGNYEDYGDGWRSTGDPDKDGGGGVANSDPDGDNAWGTDGYYVARAGVVASSLPAYITSVTDNRQGISVEGEVWDDATLPIAPDVSPDLGAAFWKNGASIIFTVTLAQDASFVITVIFDNSDTASYDIGTITVAGPGPTSDTTTGWTENNIINYAFFEVSGEAGDVFTVTAGGGDANHVVGGLGFEAVPAAASTPGTLIYGK